MKRVDAALMWPAQRRYKNRPKAFFFTGAEYRRFDAWRGAEDFGYPKPISEGWHGLWTAGIDAAVLWPVEVKDSDRKGAKRLKAYFFKGASYIRWDVEDDVLDFERPIADHWPGWPSEWTQVDAALALDEESVVFFSGSEYAYYSVVDDTFHAPSPIDSKWPGLPASGIDAAIRWPAGKNGKKAYFFFGDKYVRYDRRRLTLDEGYPRTIEDEWPAWSFSVFAAAPDSPTSVAKDARLHDDKGNLYRQLYPLGLTRGQAGWDLGLNVKGPDHLLKLFTTEPLPEWIGDPDESIPKGSITRLGLLTHGKAGELHLYGRGNALKTSHDTLLNRDGRPYVETKQLAEWLAPDATVVFMGCLAGAGDREGTDLLSRLSELLPGRTIVLFWTIGYAWAPYMERDGKGCEPGMRDTPQTNTSVHDKATKAYRDFEELMRDKKNWNDLERFPWASEHSPHARVMKDGKMVRDTKPKGH